MAKGFIKLHRKITDHWLWDEKPFDKAHAWIDLLFMASWKDATRDFKGDIITQKRGEVLTSVKSLSLRWGWSEGKVKRYIATLEADGMCTSKRLRHGRLLTIENYSLFQDRRLSDGLSDGLSDDDNRRKDKESNKEEKKDIADEASEGDFVPMPEELKEKLLKGFKM